MPGGDLPEYIKNNPDADRLKLVSVPPAVFVPPSSPPQLSDIANGLYYLHSCNVVHGDLKGVCDRSKSRSAAVLMVDQLNILVDGSGRARIADFGLATVTQSLDSVRSASCHHALTARWTAPEVLDEGTYSKEADIFSFAMVMIEVRRARSMTCPTLAYCRFPSTQLFTGAIPFNNGSSIMAISAITRGRRPPRPTHPMFTEDLWTLMQRCWDQEPHLRPEVSQVLRVLAPLVSHSLRRLCTR